MINSWNIPARVLVATALVLLTGCTASYSPPPDPFCNDPTLNRAPASVPYLFAGIPYRHDGALDHSGRFTLFADQQFRPTTAGLNCSGFTTAAARCLLQRNFTLNEVMRDRLADSGPGAEKGEDWDFGYDLILNLSEGLPRRVLLPFGQIVEVAGQDGASLRGFDLHDFAAWTDVLGQMRPGYLYLFSMSKPSSTEKHRLLHYHVGIILPDQTGHLWLSHATTRQGVNSIDLASAVNLKALLEANPDNLPGKRMILILEVPLP